MGTALLIAIDVLVVLAVGSFLAATRYDGLLDLWRRL